MLMTTYGLRSYLYRPTNTSATDCQFGGIVQTQMFQESSFFKNKQCKLQYIQTKTERVVRVGLRLKLLTFPSSKFWRHVYFSNPNAKPSCNGILSYGSRGRDNHRTGGHKTVAYECLPAHAVMFISSSSSLTQSKVLQR